MPADRKAVFQHFLSCYHNSFANSTAGLHEHSSEYIRRICESGNLDLGAQALRLDPRLTSTDAGAVAYTIAKAVSEDKGLSPYFLDIELAGKVLMVTFEHRAEAKRINRCLAEVGKVGVFARPGENLSDSVVSDIFLIGVEPHEQVRESVIAQLRTRFAESAYSGGEVAGDKPADDEQAKPKDKKDGEKKKKDDKDDKEDEEPSKDSLECALSATCCAALGLDERVFGDAALSKFAGQADAIGALFSRILGETALMHATTAEFPGMDHEKPEHRAASKTVMAKGAKVRIRKHHGMHHMHSAEAGHEHHLMASAMDRDTLTKHADRHGLHVVEATEGDGAGLAEASAATAVLLARALGARGLLEGGVARPLPEAVAKVVDAVVAKVNEAGFTGDPLVEVAIAIDGLSEMNTVDAVYGLFVDRVADTHLTPMDAARRAKLVEHSKAAGAADEKVAIANALQAIARLALRERGVDVEGDKPFIEAWRAHVAEATKPAPEPVDPAADLLSSILTTKP